ncbi:ABC transporter permease [Paracoccus aminophilus]|uniref:Peptide/nickel transport system, permease protein n=1 Tax=Paracoccus aminophilus JCM 7686 TaxID=1367847 RepID=S5YUB0_PARAH|nr:ABC transporter permease [Paracoccus aminophilus]AGT08831.1 peptide/nickel transport system, permease protein [Paracoccus aminophilus JCM 7686]
MGFILKRLISALPVVPIVAVVIFLLIHAGGSDPARILAGDTATEASVEALRRHLALDRPLGEQFLAWLVQLGKGDLGTSIFYQRPVAEIILGRTGATAALALSAIFLSVLIGVPAGAYAAMRLGKPVDKAVTFFSALGFSMPIFLVAYSMVYLFSLKLGWLPAQGYAPPSNGLWAFVRSLALPALTLSIFNIALFARVSRATVSDMLKQDFIRTAAAKGASPRRILFVHAMRAAAVPIVTLIGTTFAGLIGGVVVTESLFNIPGLGRLVTEAILKRDFPIIQGLVLMTSVLYVMINLCIDLICAALDPRLAR